MHAHPEADWPETRAAIDRLAAAVRSRLRTDSDEGRLAHLHDVLFEVAGFGGATEDYYRPANSYLPSVLRSKRGIPISLVLLYKLVAERVGLRVDGVNAPGHFLAAIRCREAAGERLMYVDPFYGGRLLTADEARERVRETTGHDFGADTEVLSTATNPGWISRMLLNLQAIFAAQGNERDLYAMQELQACLVRGNR